MTNLVPRPCSVTEHPGSITWTSPLRIRVGRDFRGVVELFGDDLRASVGWDVVIDDAGSPDLEVRRDDSLADEAFRLRVGATTTIEASAAAGVAYALIVLRQLGPAALWSTTPTTLDSAQLARVDIDDGPRFGWRGVHLDVARHFFDVATVCRLIDQIAAHRLNRLHLHLNDDQGWRVEVPTWPRLTEVGSQRRSSPVGHEELGLDDDAVHGGYYSAQDIETIRRHAARRMVQVIPEIDLPGHAQAVIAAYPELGNVTEPVEVWTRWGISEHVLNVGPVALSFAEEVVRYVAGLFPGSPVHIGGDECPTIEWESSAKALAVMLEHRFSDARQLQGLYTERLAAALAADGHEVVAWDEVLDAHVPAGTIIAAWRHVSKGTEAARRGFDVVMAPMEFVYFDWLSSDHVDEPVAVAPQPFFTTWEKVYGFCVIPLDLEPEFHHHVRGPQAQLWTEYIATRDHLDYMAFPRLAAFAEVAWGTTKNVDEFRGRLEGHLDRLTAMGVRFRPLDVA